MKIEPYRGIRKETKHGREKRNSVYNMSTQRNM